jgi:cytoskeleton protein RodZ
MFKVEIISGRDLKNLRESQGLDLNDVHRVTKISPTVLKAIENNEIGRLPRIYLRSFLKSYAEMLQVDTNIVVEGYLRSIGKS